MAWLLIYTWLNTPLEAHIEYVASFDRQEYCQIMMEEFSEQRTGYVCVLATMPYVPELLDVENFHKLSGKNKHAILR